MSEPSRGLVLAGGLAAAITLVMAWPVFLHPSQLIYGREIVGRQPDAYAVIYQFGSSGIPGAFTQPLTDVPGWLLGRVMHPVAAFNVLLLLSFPLSAMAAYALARYLIGSHGGALIAGLAFAFAPSHLAHAAYHPYVVHTEWIPLFLLALVAIVDRCSLPRTAALAAASAGLLLSNVYGGLVGVVLSPVVLVTFWAIRKDADRNPWPLVRAAAVLAALAVVAAALVWKIAPQVFADAPRFSIEDVALYRAHWWAYFTPPVDHALLGRLGGRVFNRQGINVQLTEQQLYIGYSWLLLALIAAGLSIVRWTTEVRLRVLPAALVVALVAAVVSLGPTAGSCGPTSMAPACLIQRVAPMLRAYARFGLVAQLMVAVAAGAGASLLASASSAGRRVAAVILALAVVEYWPLPARAHDVLPTAAHRWVATAPAVGRTLDCYPGSQTQATIPWMMGREVSLLDGPIQSCGDPQLGARLAGLGYAQVLVRRSPAASPLPPRLPAGISLAHEFVDSDLYAVDSTPPPIVTVSTSGFFAYERDNDDWWQWMGPRGEWGVRNTTAGPRRVSLAVSLVSVGMPRRVTVTLDGRSVGVLEVGVDRRDVVVGPWTLSPGSHTLGFSAEGDPIRPSEVDDSKDSRALTVAFHNDRWVDEP